jgi:hypothetical protein
VQKDTKYHHKIDLQKYWHAYKNNCRIRLIMKTTHSFNLSSDKADKDQGKANYANAYIGFGVANRKSSTGIYSVDAQRADIPVNYEIVPVYHVYGTLFRQPKLEVNPVIVDKVFKSENLFEARKSAFRYFQNYVDVFLESKGEVYRSHETMQSLLQDFVNSNQTMYSKIGGEKIDADSDKGLFIYLVDGESKYLIHGFDNGFVDLHPYILVGLVSEYKLYQQYNYKHNEQDIRHWPLKDGKTVATLTTPLL